MVRIFSILCLLFVVAVPMIGCGNSSDKPESIVSPERVTQIVEMRKLFDKAGGDWNKLSPDDQAAYTKMAGDADKAKAMWTQMATPVGAAPKQP